MQPHLPTPTFAQIPPKNGSWGVGNRLDSLDNYGYVGKYERTKGLKIGKGIGLHIRSDSVGIGLLLPCC